MLVSHKKSQTQYYLAISFGRVLFEDRPHPLQGYPPVLLSCRAAQVKHQPQVVHVSLYFEGGGPLCAHFGKKIHLFTYFPLSSVRSLELFLSENALLRSVHTTLTQKRQFPG